MPLSPSESKIDARNSKRVQAIFDYIDTCLKDEEYMREHQHACTNPSWEFRGKGELLSDEKKVIQEAYEEVGWGECRVLSAEYTPNGLWSITLWRDKFPRG